VRKMLGLLLVLLVAAAPLQAWDGFGHMEVAYLAYQKLTPAMQARVWTLLQLNPYFTDGTWAKMLPAGISDADKQLMIFMIAATWPDEIKGDSGYSDDGTNGGNTPNGTTSRQNTGYTDKLRHKYWHFIDRPFAQDGTKKLPKIPAPNAQTQIAAFRKVLASKTKPEALKSYDLVWLLHLVGDVHQPLHCTTRIGAGQPDGDAGGNLVKCSNCDPGSGNLHSYWDDLPGTTPNNSPDLQAIITAAQALPAATEIIPTKQPATVWIGESFGEAKTAVYYDPPIGLGLGPFPLTSDYQTAAQDLGKKRLALAGARLAKLLNDELK
jgi:S1/P1 Nuclease